MDPVTFGITITIVGMGSTLLSLWFLTLIINLLKRIFPYRKLDEDKKESEP